MTKSKEAIGRNKIGVHAFKDQVIFEEDEVLKPDGGNYTIYTPYKNKWLQQFQEIQLPVSTRLNATNLAKNRF